MSDNTQRHVGPEEKVSEQTIYRKIDFLKQRGSSIRSEKHANGWAYHLLTEPATGLTEKESARK